ncbi:hypothetical protein A3207_00775 [Candidatus Methanomassiliicoccus intestinalis]|uniref:Uncharacterized protein n=2 Tax=Candidatus Methanomassiliicoccus intestinalis TaxID=1406512 RepID=R9T9I8_METII|nr:hypothetical protein [Candidatus Methanomassiliicoccus intestinalis]AGN26316.1 hypothetical protein MMINT_09620 [Candidatus Methanomassiliicoccus intestinalis Issoire-Mx1]TQS84610.1 MAG: hypothetical protein A3207_00775 [Candidatus Methanomassiliicoccus intestinalis]
MPQEPMTRLSKTGNEYIDNHIYILGIKPQKPQEKAKSTAPAVKQAAKKPAKKTSAKKTSKTASKPPVKKKPANSGFQTAVGTKTIKGVKIPVTADGYVPQNVVDKFQAGRSKNARTADGSFDAKNTFTMPITPEEFYKWTNRPGSYDVKGQDTRTRSAAGNKTAASTGSKSRSPVSGQSTLMYPEQKKKVTLRIRRDGKTEDYSGKSVKTIIQREFGRSNRIRLLPNYSDNSPEYFTIGEWMPDYHANNVLGVVYDVEVDDVSLSKQKARKLIKSEMEDK